MLTLLLVKLKLMNVRIKNSNQPLQKGGYSNLYEFEPYTLNLTPYT